MILLYILLAVVFIVFVSTTVNRKISEVAVAAFIVGLPVYIMIDQTLGAMILRIALFVICLLIVIPVAKSILGEEK